MTPQRSGEQHVNNSGASELTVGKAAAFASPCPTFYCVRIGNGTHKLRFYALHSQLWLDGRSSE